MIDVDDMPTMDVIHLLALKDNQIFDMQAERNALLKHLRDLQEKWTNSPTTYERSIAGTCATIADDLDNGNFKYLGIQALKGIQ